jgi:hypothetical protein
MIECWPFSPPVALRYSAHIEEAKEDIHLPGGIHIGKGARGITLQDVRVIDGSLTDDPDAFDKKNTVRIEKGHRQVAGENLAIYSASDYLSAIRMLVRTIHKALSRDLDDVLCRAYKTRYGLNL